MTYRNGDKNNKNNQNLLDQLITFGHRQNIFKEHNAIEL